MRNMVLAREGRNDIKDRCGNDRGDARLQQPLHDFCVVLASQDAEARRGELAAVRHNPHELADRPRRIHHPRAGQQAWRGERAERGAAQNHTGSHNRLRICSVHAALHGREVALGLPLGLSLHDRRRLFRKSRAIVDCGFRDKTENRQGD